MIIIDDIELSISGPLPCWIQIEQDGRCINFTHRKVQLIIDALKHLKKEAIIEALEATNYNISQAARILGVNRRTIQRYRKKYQL